MIQAQLRLMNSLRGGNGSGGASRSPGSKVTARR
jgi:hypothetical protein